MKFAVSLAFSPPDHWLPLARTADECGWDVVLLSDHVVHPEKIDSPYPYTEDGSPRWDAPTPWPDVWVAVGAMGAVTRRVRFMTGIYILPLRNPFVVAKAVGTAAVFAGGRVSLGIGMGWMKEEFDLLEQPFSRRGKRADEMLEVLKKLWSGEVVEHHGDFYDFAPLSMKPAPPEPIPIVVGGLSEPALKRAARLGDGWISDMHTTEELREICARLAALRAECGRADEPFEVVAACTDAVDVDGYRRVRDVGVTCVQTMPWLFYGGFTDNLTQKQEGIRRFAEDVFPKLRDEDGA
jgi:probable F420-dependent oxidoreductase